MIAAVAMAAQAQRQHDRSEAGGADGALRPPDGRGLLLVSRGKLRKNPHSIQRTAVHGKTTGAEGISAKGVSTILSFESPTNIGMAKEHRRRRRTQGGPRGPGAGCPGRAAAPGLHGPRSADAHRQDGHGGGDEEAIEDVADVSWDWRQGRPGSHPARDAAGRWRSARARRFGPAS